MSKTRKSTTEVLGIWKSFQNANFNYGEFAIIRSQAGLNSIGEQLNNPDFNSVEFDGIKMLAGLNSYKMQVLTTAPALKQIKE